MITRAGSTGRIEDFSYTRTTEGRVEWIVRSRVAEYFRERNQAVFDGVVVTFYPEDGGELSIRGRRGVLHTDTEDVEVEGNIIARSDQGYRLLTNSVRYDAEADEVSTSDPVIFFGDGISVSGVGMKIEVKLEKLALFGPVRAVAWNVTAPSGGFPMFF